MKVNRRIVMDVFWIVLGVTLFVLGQMDIIDSVFCGMGGGFIGVGIAQLIRALKYKTNAEYRENFDIEVNDERNKQLRMMAWSWTGYFMVLILGVSVIVLTILAQGFYAQILSFVLCLIICLYWISYMIIKKKY